MFGFFSLSSKAHALDREQTPPPDQDEYVDNGELTLLNSKDSRPHYAPRGPPNKPVHGRPGGIRRVSYVQCRNVDRHSHVVYLLQ